ncbi:hypothetical protein V8C42DRAFT_339888 [Trichoderma barbatum]
MAEHIHMLRAELQRLFSTDQDAANPVLQALLVVSLIAIINLTKVNTILLSS